jgi:hypothetical protein
MRKIILLWAGLALIAAAAATFSMPPVGMKAKRVSGPPVGPASEPSAAAGFKVHVDPATGQIIPPPMKAQAEPAEKAMFPSSHEGLVEEPGTTAAGGFKVDVRGKFRSAVMLQTGADGKPRMMCVDAAGTEPRPRE